MSLRWIIIIPIGVFVFFTALFWNRWAQNDTPVAWATKQYPMGYAQVYVVQKNKAVLDDQGNEELSADTLYTLLKHGEREQQPYVSGRAIGSSTVPLDEFLDKPILLDGYFDEARPILLRPSASSVHGEIQVVLHITGVRPIHPE